MAPSRVGASASSVILRHVTVGDGPSLVLLHGLFGQAANFGTLQRRLARGGPHGTRRVIALDLRNHGQSPHAPGMSYPAMAEDVLETLRSLDALPCRFIGHSMGGKVAMAAALAAPAAVARLLVADIAPVRYDPHFRGYVDAMLALPVGPELTRAEADLGLAAAVPEAHIRAFLLQNLRLGPQAGWRVGLTEISAGLATIEDWPAIDEPPYAGPTLFVAGERSDYIRPEYRPAIRALFPAARMVTLKDAGHWLHADNPSGFLSLVESFAG